MRAYETNERRIAKFSEKMDPFFVGRNAQCCSIRSLLTRTKQREDE